MMQITIAKISEQLSEKKKDYENLEIKIKKVKIEIDKKNEEYKMLEEEINKLKIDIIVYESTFKIVTQEQAQEQVLAQAQEQEQEQELAQEHVQEHVQVQEQAQAQELAQAQAQAQEQKQKQVQVQVQEHVHVQVQKQEQVVVLNKRKNNSLEKEEDSNTFKKYKLSNMYDIFPVFSVPTNPCKDTSRFLREASAALGAIDKPNRYAVTENDNFGFFSTSHSKVYVIGVKDNNKWTTDVENRNDKCKIIWGCSYTYKKNEEMDNIKMNLKNIMVNYKYHNNVKHNLIVMLIANSTNSNHIYDIKLYSWSHE